MKNKNPLYLLLTQKTQLQKTHLTNQSGNKRFYYAGSIEKKKEIPARLTQHKKTMVLETYEEHDQALYVARESTLFFNDTVPPISKMRQFIGTLRRPFFEKVWDKRFWINERGLIESNPHSIDSSELLANAKKTSGSMDELQAKDAHIIWKKHHNAQYSLELPYTPDLLYSISQEMWSQFVKQLPYQDVAQILNLSQHRHLWPSYNYSVNTRNNTSLREIRAHYFGQYHFLQSFVSNTLHTQNLSLNALVLAAVDNKISPLQFFAKHSVAFTPLFLNKFAYCPSWHDVKTIGMQFVVFKAYERNPILNKSKIHEVIAALPSSKDEPIRFGNMINDYKTMQINLPKTSEKTKSNLFYHQRLHFGLFAELQLDEDRLHDYVKALTNDLIYPEFIRHILAHDYAELLIKKLPPLNPKSILDFLSETMHLKSLVLLEQRWHRNLPTIGGLKPDPLFKQHWHALFEPVTINSVTFTCITTREQLKNEADIMRHCVGGYADYCMRGDTHIISATMPTGNRSTIELQTHKDNQSSQLEQFFINQNMTFDNEISTPEMKEVSQQLEMMINKGNIVLNPQRGRIADTENDNNKHTDSLLAPTSPAYDIYPYPFSAHETQEAIYQAYKKNQSLPVMFTATTYKNALQKSKLNLFIQDIVNNLVTHHVENWSLKKA